MLRCGTRRPRLDWADRALLAALVRLLRPDRRLGLLVIPATLLRWHRDLARRRWRNPHRRPGRPAIPVGTRELILRLARETRAAATSGSPERSASLRSASRRRASAASSWQRD